MTGDDDKGAMTRRGLMLVLSSPSGAGKTTISRALLKEEDELVMSVSATTRPPRPGEVDGEDYFFVEPVDFNLPAALSCRPPPMRWKSV